MKRRIALVVTGVVLAGVAVWASGAPARRGFGASPTAFLAKRRGAELPKSVSVEPYGLTARLPGDWSCQLRADTTCRNRSVSITWKVEGDTRVGSPNDIVDEGFSETVSKDEEFVLSLELAGFVGYLTSWQMARGGEKGCTFVGWRRDDPRGLLKLQIQADLGCSDETTNIIASTTGPKHLPTWPDAAIRERRAPLFEAFDVLANDEKEAYQWQAAFDTLTKKELVDLVEPLRARTNPSVTDLVKRRIVRAIEGDPDSFTSAIAMAHGFETWEPLAFSPALDDIAKRASERALATKSTVTRDASRFRGIDCGLADGIARRRSDPAPIRALTERLGHLHVTPLTLANDCANVLFRQRQVPESQALLEKRFAPESLPNDVDYTVLAEFTVPRVKESALMKRHVMAMLRNETPGAATLSVRGQGFDMNSVRRGVYYAETVGRALPADGTKISLRTCDVYAHIARAIIPYESEQQRDKGIARLLAELVKLPEKFP